MKTAIFFCLMTAVGCLPALADNWGHWRGPTGNSVAQNAHPPTQWSATENVKWKVAIPGRSSGSPVVWGDQVFVVSAISQDGPTSQKPPLSFDVFCFNRQTGDKLWQQTAIVATPGQRTHATNGFASGSPCTDGQFVYAFFGSRGLYCYTMDGQLVWKRDDFGEMKTRNGFGEGASPTIVGDKIIVPWDQEGPSFLYAIDKATGKDVWKTPRDEPTCWATPLVVTHDGRQQIVMNGQNAARSYDLETGKELWRCGGQTQRPVASAVSAGDLVFVGSGFRGNFMGAFRLGGSGDIENTNNVAWTRSRDCPDIGSPLLSGNRLYYYKGKSGLLSCVDAKTGVPFYETQRLPNINSTYASPVAAGGKVFLTGRSGTTVVIEDAETLKILSTNSVGETVDATPAPAGDELFIRGEKHLFCIAE